MFMSCRRCLSLIVVFLPVLSHAQSTAIDNFMRIDTSSGTLFGAEDRADKYKNWWRVTSFSWSLDRSGQARFHTLGVSLPTLNVKNLAAIKSLVARGEWVPSIEIQTNYRFSDGPRLVSKLRCQPARFFTASFTSQLTANVEVYCEDRIDWSDFTYRADGSFEEVKGCWSIKLNSAC